MQELRRLTSTFLELLLILSFRDRTREELEKFLTNKATDAQLTTMLHAWEILGYLQRAEWIHLTQKGRTFLGKLYQTYARGVSLCPVCEYPWDHRESLGVCDLPLDLEIPKEQPGDIVSLRYNTIKKAHAPRSIPYTVVQFFYAQPYHALGACIPSVHELCIAFQGLEVGGKEFTMPYGIFCSLKA